jgi:hypothetical protein
MSVGRGVEVVRQPLAAEVIRFFAMLNAEKGSVRAFCSLASLERTNITLGWFLTCRAGLLSLAPERNRLAQRHVIWLERLDAVKADLS